MERGFISYHLSGSGRDEWFLYSANRSYRLPDGTTLILDVGQEPVWCPKCDHFVNAERIAPTEELLDEIVRCR